MDDFSRADDASAEDLADGLMPEADAENRDLAAELTNDLLGDARVLRNAGTRRDDDAAIDEMPASCGMPGPGEMMMPR